MHAFGVHWPLEKCKKPRTGRGFLQINKGKASSPFGYPVFLTIYAKGRPPKRTPFCFFIVVGGIKRGMLLIS